MPSTETAYIWTFSEIRADRIILNCKFYTLDDFIDCFIFLAIYTWLCQSFMILMCALWRRLRLNQEGSKTFSSWVAHGTSPRYSDIIYGCFFTINSIPYMTYSNKNTLSTDCLAQLLLCFHTFTLSEYMKDHIIELQRKVWRYEDSIVWHKARLL